MESKKRFGLPTAVAMIVGICVGSGIFFKSDNILTATGGSVPLGVLVFLLAAAAIVFGGLAMGELAARTARPGGVFTYFEVFAGLRPACAFGWFQILIYYPTITVVVSYVVGVYTCILFGWPASLPLQVAIGMAFCALCFLYNVLWTRLGGAVQNLSTVVKLIPLALLGVGGLLFGDPLEGLRQVSLQDLANTGWLAAVGPIAYSYDGWVVSTSIAHEVSDARRNLPRALVAGPLVILTIYLLYFVGISCYVGPQQVMALGDAHVSLAAASLFGEGFAKAITLFVIFSVMGTVNGLVMGYIRMPYSMALRPGMVPGSPLLRRLHPRLGVPVYSSLVCFALCLFWMAVHYVTTRYGLLPNSDVSEIAIAVSYLFYVRLYWQIYRMHRKGQIPGRWKGVWVPLLATCGAAIILSGGLQNRLFFLYAALCLAVVLAALAYHRAKER